MNGKTKKVKLTDNQQTVVNLMAKGWELYSFPDMGRFAKASCSLWTNDRKGDHKVPANMASQLLDKGVVEPTEDRDWRSTAYRLTEFGKSLVKEQVAKTETWWCIGKHSAEANSKEFAGSTGETLLEANGRRTKKYTERQTWFPSREQAIEAIRARLEREVESTEQALKAAQKRLRDFNRNEPQT